MDQQDIRTLKILEEIEHGQTPSQRDLARKLNISLGLVNSFVKRLVRKGYFKITNIPANRVKYILTPKGAAEKTRLTYEFIKYSFDYYKITRQKLDEHFFQFAEQGVKRIIFYGASELAEIAYISLQGFSIDLVAIIDETKVGESFLGYVVAEPSHLEVLCYDKVLVTVIGPPPKETIEKLSKKVFAGEKLIML